MTTFAKENFHKRQYVLLIVLIITPLPQLLIDMYLPALPAIKSFFNSTASAAQLSLPVYLITYSASMVIFGVFSDAYGRKLPLLIGLSICSLGLVISSFSTTIAMFLAGRAIQGLGIGVIGSIVWAVMADVFEGKKLLHAIMYTNIAYAVAPIIAPYIGGVTLQFTKWQGIFILLLAYAFISLFIVKLGLSETHLSRAGTISSKKVLTDFKRILTSFNFVMLLLVISCPWSVIIAFNLVGPFIFQETYGLSPYRYGEICLLMGGANLISAFIARFMLKYVSPQKLISIGVVYYAVVAIGFYFSLMASFENIYIVTAFSFMLFASSSLVFGSIASLALVEFTDISGLASSMFLASANLVWAFISYIMSFLPSSAFSLSASALILSLLGCGLWGYYLFKQNVPQSQANPLTELPAVD